LPIENYELTNAKEIFGIDIIGKLIDQYIIMPDNKLAYVSAGDGIISNPKEGINIRLDNNRYDYIYITNDGINIFDFYGIMSQVGSKNTVNQTPYPGYAKKLFMFKALGKL